MTPKTNRTEQGPEAIDRHLGAVLRQHRTLQGLSLAALAEKIGVTYQQIQKYEIGENRISAPILWRLSNALRIRIDKFFVGFEPDDGPNPETLFNRDALEVLRAYQSISDYPTRSAFKKMLLRVAMIAGERASGEGEPEARSNGTHRGE